MLVLHSKEETSRKVDSCFGLCRSGQADDVNLEFDAKATKLNTRHTTSSLKQ